MTEQNDTKTTSSISAAQFTSMNRSIREAVMQQAFASASSTPEPKSSGGFNLQNLIIAAAGFCIAIMGAYIVTMMSFKEDISSNRESVSVLKTDISYIKSDLSRIENEAKLGNSALENTRLAEVKFNYLKNRFLEHTKDKHDK